jgi:hypothetical protein
LLEVPSSTSTSCQITVWIKDIYSTSNLPVHQKQPVLVRQTGQYKTHYCKQADFPNGTWSRTKRYRRRPVKYTVRSTTGSHFSIFPPGYPLSTVQVPICTSKKTFTGPSLSSIQNLRVSAVSKPTCHLGYKPKIIFCTGIQPSETQDDFANAKTSNYCSHVLDVTPCLPSTPYLGIYLSYSTAQP